MLRQVLVLPVAVDEHSHRKLAFNPRTVGLNLDNGGTPSSAERGSLGCTQFAGLGFMLKKGVLDKHCRDSSTLTAIGGNDGILVWGDIEGDFAGVGKCGRGNSGVVGEALALSPINCCNGISGDSGEARMSSSFAFSC